MWRPPDSHAPHPSLNPLPLPMLAAQADGHQPSVAALGQQARFTSGQEHTPATARYWRSRSLASLLHTAETAGCWHPSMPPANTHHTRGWPQRMMHVHKGAHPGPEPPPSLVLEPAVPLVTGGGFLALGSLCRGMAAPARKEWWLNRARKIRCRQVVLYMKPVGKELGKNSACSGCCCYCCRSGRREREAGAVPQGFGGNKSSAREGQRDREKNGRNRRGKRKENGGERKGAQREAAKGPTHAFGQEVGEGRC